MKGTGEAGQLLQGVALSYACLEMYTGCIYLSGFSKVVHLMFRRMHYMRSESGMLSRCRRYWNLDLHS